MYLNHNELIHNTKHIKEKPFLKAHIRSGAVCIFEDNNWKFDSISNSIEGKAKYYDFSRNIVMEGIHKIGVDSINLF